MGKILDALKKAEKEATIQKQEAELGGGGEKAAARPEPQAPPQVADPPFEQPAPAQQQEALTDKPFERPPEAQADEARPEPKKPTAAPLQPTDPPPQPQAPVQQQEPVREKPVERPQQDPVAVVQPEIRPPRPTPPTRKKEDYIAAARAALEMKPPQQEKGGDKFSLFKQADKFPFTLYYPDSLVAEQFRLLRSRLSKMATENHLKTFLITSALASEGKSMVASNLAITIARGLEEQVLLVDADFRRPTQDQLFNLEPQKGLSDFLLSEQSLKNFIQKTPIPNLSFLSSGTELSNPAELIASAGMKYFFDEIHNQYPDYSIIIDSTPVLQTSESIILAEQVDGVIFVVQAGKTDRPLVKNAIEILGKKKILGVIFNNSTLPIRSYYGY